MSTTTPESVAESVAGSTTESSTATTPTVTTRARRLRLPIVIVAVVLGLAVVTALLADRGVGVLDIDSYSPEGSHAVAAVLRDEGVAVRQVRLLDEAASTAGGTLVVVGPDLLTPDQIARLTGSGATSVVVVGSGAEDVVDAFAPGTQVARVVDTAVLDPACALPAAVAAGSADAGLVAYTAPAAGTSVGCYPTGGDPSLLEVRSGDQRVVLMGNPAPLQNERFGKEGNAALALDVLGAEGDVTWYLPSLTDLFGPDGGPDQGKSVSELVPDWVIGGLVWLAVVVALLAMWRARRLGPIVDESLPVVVRASETDEGRARLYRRGRNRDRAAALLRGAARDRLTPLLGLPLGVERPALVQAVAARSGRTPADVDALLYGAAPHDDARLVRLADELDRLDREVHGP